MEPPRLAVLIGPNAAGKSNLLDAFQMLARTAAEQTLADALAPPIRGFPQEPSPSLRAACPSCSLSRRRSSLWKPSSSSNPKAGVRSGCGTGLRWPSTRTAANSRSLTSALSSSPRAMSPRSALALVAEMLRRWWRWRRLAQPRDRAPSSRRSTGGASGMAWPGGSSVRATGSRRVGHTDRLRSSRSSRRLSRRLRGWKRGYAKVVHPPESDDKFDKLGGYLIESFPRRACSPSPRTGTAH